MLGLGGILHMGSNDKFDRITKKKKKKIIYFLLFGTKLSNLGLKRQLNPGAEEV